jgi:hypothetical protein
MKRSKFSPTQIANILKEFDQGKDVASHKQRPWRK